MVKLSLIIPYFNTYELTEKLLRNLIAQDSKELEIILIDDGCNETRFDDWKGFENINVIHQENKGVAASRNYGIDIAKGKYIGFIDSDDMVMPNYVETLLDAINKYDTDVINFNWYDMTSHEEIRKPDNYAVWKAIYKKETIPKFEVGFRYGHEDVFFQQKITNGDYTITYLDKLLYFYNSNREGSLVWQKTHEK